VEAPLRGGFGYAKLLRDDRICIALKHIGKESPLFGRQLEHHLWRFTLKIARILNVVEKYDSAAAETFHKVVINYVWLVARAYTPPLFSLTANVSRSGDGVVFPFDQGATAVTVHRRLVACT
jgi:hypothetical protein